jgi:hypothetical protein
MKVKIYSRYDTTREPATYARLDFVDSRDQPDTQDARQIKWQMLIFGLCLARSYFSPLYDQVTVYLNLLQYLILSSTSWLSILCYTVRCRTGFATNNLSGSCRIRYRAFPVKTPAFMLTVQWVANPLCTYMLYCVPYNCLLAY